MTLGRTDRVLLAVVWAGTALLLLTPVVITNETIFPLVVGKALYSRTLIEIVFLAWAVLAYRRAEYRPPAFLDPDPPRCRPRCGGRVGVLRHQCAAELLVDL